MRFSRSFCLPLKVPSVLYHCTKFYKFSPSPFRDIFNRNANFPEISRVQDRYLHMREPGACIGRDSVSGRAAQAARAKKLFRATLNFVSTAKIFHNVIIHNRGTNPVTRKIYGWNVLTTSIYVRNNRLRLFYEGFFETNSKIRICILLPWQQEQKGPNS